MIRGSILSALFVCLGVMAPGLAVVIDEEAVIEGDFLSVTTDPRAGGVVTRFSLKSAAGNIAGPGGLLQEGFGVGSRYVPNRRLNVQLEADEGSVRPVLRYSYDCDGPNIAGLHVTRAIEFFPDETSVRVTWEVENRGSERQWVVPWVRCDATPGGTVGEEDRYDVPSLEGVVSPQASVYHGAARNWIAVTDRIEEQSLCLSFDAEQVYAYLTLWEEESAQRGVQAVFMPILLEAGASWRTVYRMGAFRGIQRVDFASDEVAVELRRDAGQLVALLSACREIPGAEFHARVVAANGRVWQLPAKQVDLSPNRGARCTYDWLPIGDGPYEFLGQFRRGGEALALGVDTRSPHGGVDTQFVVGDGAAALEPWTDAPQALERGARQLERRVAVNGPVTIWYASSAEKVFREDKVADGAGVDPVARLVLARNEYESFQVVLRPEDTTLRNVRFEAGPLTHENGSAVLEIDVLSVLYHRVRIPSYFEGPTGWWPDALPPYEPFDAEPGQAVPVWLRVHARATDPSGTYRGAIRVLSEGQDPVELPVEATVFDFALPTTPALKTDFGYWSKAALAGARAFGAQVSQTALDAAYLENALAHRVTLRDLASFPQEAADYAAALKAFAPRAKELLARGASTMAVPPSLIDFPEQLALANAFAVANGFADRTFAPLGDEPAEPAWPRMLETVQRWKDAAPKLPVMVTTSGLRPLIHEGIDVLAVHSPVFDTPLGQDLLDRIGTGGEVWWYVNDAPPRPYANLLLDFSAVEHRVLFWQAWALGVKGMHYWAINYAGEGQDPWRDSLDSTPVNGDGLLVYPGPDGPVDSIRWECVRDGIEDYDYLVLFSTLRNELVQRGDPQALLDAAARAGDLSAILPDLVSYSREPRLLLDKRTELASMIVAMQQALR